MDAKEIKAELDKQLATQGTLPIVNGVFGDIENCHGILQYPIIYPPEGGTRFKVFGCTYEFKGFPEINTVEGLGLAKALVSALPRELIVHNFPNLVALAWNALFNRRRFIHMARVVFATIQVNEVAKIGIAPEKYNEMSREIRRAVNTVIDRIVEERHYSKEFANLHGNFEVSTDKEWLELIASATEFIVLFLELDSAYRFRVQDMLENVNKENVKKNVVKEVRRLLDLLIERENPDHGIRYKIIPASHLIVLLLRLNKDFRYFAKQFLLELDISKVSLDESDWYFCLQRRAHKVRGMSLEERMVIKKMIDQEKGHIFLDMDSSYLIDCPTCKSQLSFPQKEIQRLRTGVNINVPGA